MNKSCQSSLIVVAAYYIDGWVRCGGPDSAWNIEYSKQDLIDKIIFQILWFFILLVALS